MLHPPPLLQVPVGQPQTLDCVPPPQETLHAPQAHQSLSTVGTQVPPPQALQANPGQQLEKRLQEPPEGMQHCPEIAFEHVKPVQQGVPVTNDPQAMPELLHTQSQPVGPEQTVLAGHEEQHCDPAIQANNEVQEETVLQSAPLQSQVPLAPTQT